MVRYRLDFILAKIGFTSLQKVFHTKRKWVKLKKFEERRPRPFRLRINDIRLFMRNTDSDEEYTDSDIIPKGPAGGRKIGELGAGPYDIFFRPGINVGNDECRIWCGMNLCKFFRSGFIMMLYAMYL